MEVNRIEYTIQHNATFVRGNVYVVQSRLLETIRRAPLLIVVDEDMALRRE